MKEVIRQVIRSPFSYAFLAIYASAGYLGSFYHKTSWTETLFSLVFFAFFLPGVIYWLSRNVSKEEIRIKDPKKETFQVVGYFLVWLSLFMFFGEYLMANAYLSNGLAFWGFLVILPLLYFLMQGYSLSDLGLGSRIDRSHAWLTFWSCLILAGFMLILTPGGKFLLNGSLSPLSTVVALLTAFVFALLFAGFFEEFFFRGILQTRLSQALDSDLKAIILSSLLFGLYHLPFQFYGEGPAAGQFWYSLSNVCTEQMISAPLLGILWARTNNLLVPVLVHTLINTISGVPRIVEMFNIT